MKKVIIIIFVIFSINSYSQNLEVKYELCTNCGGTPTSDATNYTYSGSILTFQPTHVTSDFGRRKDASKWHRGIDYRTGSGRLGDHLFPVVGGSITRIKGTGTYKVVIVDGTSDFGYGHIFRNGTPSTSTGMRYGDMILKQMIGAQSGYYAIIYAPTAAGSDTIAFAEKAGKVVLFGDTINVTTSVSSSTPLAPQGNSAAPNSPHVHLYRFKDVSIASTGLNYGDVNNDKNPLEVIKHNEPTYEVKIENHKLNYPGDKPATPSYFQVRVKMNSTSNGPTYPDFVMNVENVMILLGRPSDSFFPFTIPFITNWFIKGPYFDSKMCLGGHLNATRYPSQGHPAGNTDKGDIAHDDRIGSKTKTGIDAYAYKNTGSQKYDDYYFADFLTRIHKDDNYGRDKAKYAFINEDARYKDGHYKVMAIMSTIRDKFTASKEKSIKIDNFRPYVKEAEIKEAGGKELYKAKWNWNATNKELTYEGGEKGKTDTKQDVIITLTLSETMKSVEIASFLNAPDLPKKDLEPVNADSTKWRTVVTSAELEKYECKDLTIKLEIKGKDSNDNPIEGFTSTDPSKHIPLRTGENSWDPAPHQKPDKIHFFKLEKHEDCDEDDGDWDWWWWIPIITGGDPNDIIGPAGYGEEKWVSVNDILPYKIRFENSPDLATAPAQRVEIRYPIDAHTEKYSFVLGNFGFGDFTFEIPEGRNFYSAKLDVVDSLGIYVYVTAGLDVAKNQAFWIFESIDPETGVASTLDPNLGMLLINDTITHRGEGFVNFTIKPLATAQTRDTIHAYADITFDDNEIIRTPEIFNIIDAHAPVSTVDSVIIIDDTPTYAIYWSGKDDENGCGVKNYDLYYSINDEPYKMLLPTTENTNHSFFGSFGGEYKFYSVARDNVHNTEALKITADTSVIINCEKFFKTLDIAEYCPRDTVVLVWNELSIVSMNLEYSVDSGKTYIPFASKVPVSDTLYKWKLPDSLSGDEHCIIRAVNSKNNNSFATTDYFYIYPGVYADAGTDTYFCTNDSVLAGGSPAGHGGTGILSYSWTPLTGLNNYNIPNPKVGTEGEYYLQVSDENSCTDIDTVVITQAALPIVNITELEEEYCLNAPVVDMQGSPVGGSFTGAGVNDTLFTPYLAGLGTHQITYLYTDIFGCTNSDTAYVTINDIPEVNISGLDENYCIDASPVSVTLSPEGGTLSGNGVSGNIFDPVTAGIGVHDIIYEYTDANECTNTDTFTVTVYKITINISGLDAGYCKNDPPVNITLSPEGGILTGEGISGNTFTPSDAGEGIHAISYTYTDAQSCSRDTVIYVSVYSTPELSLGNDTTISVSNNLLLDAGQGFTSYLWNNGSINQTLLVEGNDAGIGIHEYWVMVTDTNTCQNSDTINVTIDNQTGIELFNNLTLVKFYPNPNGGIFQLEVENHEENEILISITDPLGREVFVKEYKNNKTFNRELINLSDKSKGVYLIKVTMNNLTKVEKIIIY